MIMERVKCIVYTSTKKDVYKASGKTIEEAFKKLNLLMAEKGIITGDVIWQNHMNVK